MIIERDSPSWQVTSELSLLVLPRCYCDCSGSFNHRSSLKLLFGVLIVNLTLASTKIRKIPMWTQQLQELLNQFIFELK